MNIGSVVGKYRIDAYLGGGGAGRVYRAVQCGPVGFNRTVAIKTMRASLGDNIELQQIFAREARICALFNNRNIVQVHDFTIEGDNYFLIMEFIDGLTLREVLKHVGEKLPLGLRLYIACEIAQGLKYAHGLRDSEGQPLMIIHRDIKPANIMITTQGEVKITDFGLAKVANVEGDCLTKTGIVRGTPSYMPPEQRKIGELTQAADVFALSAVVYELVVGHKLFHLKTQQKNDFMPTLDHLTVQIPEHPEIEKLLRRGLYPDPAQRPSAAEMVENLRALIVAKSSPELTARAAEMLAEFVKEAEQKNSQEAAGLTVTDNVDLGLSPNSVVSMSVNVITDEPTPIISIEELKLEALSANSPPCDVVKPLRGKRKLVLPTALLSLGFLVIGIWSLVSRPSKEVSAPQVVVASTSLPDAKVSVARDVGLAAVTLADAQSPAPKLAIASFTNKKLSPAASITNQKNGSKKKIKASNSKTPAFGYLSVNAQPWAKVFLDNKQIGVTPLFDQKVPAGKHRLSLIGPAGQILKRNVTVTQNNHLNLGLVPQTRK